MKTMMMALLAGALVASFAQEPVKLDLDQILGLTKTQMVRYIPKLAENTTVPEWKGFEKVSFYFNATSKLNQMEIAFQKPLSEAEALSALQMAFTMKLFPAVAKRARAGVYFEGVSPKIKTVTLATVHPKDDPTHFSHAVVTSTIGYNE